MDPDFFHFDGYKGVSLSTVIAYLPQHTHHKAHPEPRGILDPLEHRAVSCMDISMRPSA